MSKSISLLTGGRQPERPANTNLTIGLRGDKLILRGPIYNRDLCMKLLKLAMEALDAPQQADAGTGGQRVLVPASAKLTDLFHKGRNKVL